LEIILIAVPILLLYFIWRFRRNRPAFLVKLENMRERKRQVQLAVINRYRAEFGRPALKVEARLNYLAKEHSRAMAARGECDYTKSAKRGRYIAKLLKTDVWNENCFSYPKGEYDKRIRGKLVQGWLRGANRDNILNRRFRRVGIGVVSRGGKVFTTQIFAG
jgi:uncharacterized protein YkwD